MKQAIISVFYIEDYKVCSNKKWEYNIYWIPENISTLT